MMDSINKETEKSTLGDLDILSKLKQAMDSSALAPEPEATPAVDEEAPADKKAAAKKPAAKKAAAKKPAAKKPAAKKPAAKK